MRSNILNTRETNTYKQYLADLGMTDYDQIADEYSKILHTARKKYIYDYSLFKHIGEVTNRSVVDLACGEGVITRAIKRKGASRVLGVDISEEQIKKAISQEDETPLGVEYLCSHGADFGGEESFDLVVGSYYFHYAKSVEELNSMVRAVSSALTKTGRLVAMNLNPFKPVADRGNWSSNYRWIDDPMKDESRIGIGLTDDFGSEVCSIINYYYAADTYQLLLEEAGFKNIEWNYPEISQKGIEEFGKKYWDGFGSIDPAILILTANK